MIDLSIVVVSYNTKDITLKCIHSILSSNISIPYEIVVIDNASVDGTVKAILALINNIQNKTQKIILIQNKLNCGFSKANNQGIKIAQGKHVLFLNSDVIIQNIHFQTLINYLDKETRVGGLTVKVFLSDGTNDPASHRGFPTLWRSFCYFGGLEKLFGRIPLMNFFFGGYHLCHLQKKSLHEIDSPSGAFFLIKKKILIETKGFDENFFMYGEDLDLSYRIKKLGYTIMYYPSYSVLHLKYQSGLQNKENIEARKITQNHFYEAMKIFYKKHYAKSNSGWLNRIVESLIEFKKHNSE